MIINGIDTNDISFVVQGAVDKKITKECLNSIRKCFPGAKIILSTWKGTNVTNLSFDQLVVSDDPGACTYSLIPDLNNINRQIVSTVAGLEIVTTKYAAKVRSDLCFESPDFLMYFKAFPKYDEQYKIVKERMIIMTMYTRIIHDNIVNPVLANYHPSDWFFFGFTEDVKKFWSIKLIEDLSAFSRYYLEHSEEKSTIPYPLMTAKITPEQYFGAHFFGLGTDETFTSISLKKQKESVKSMINNFVVLDREYSKIYSLKWIDRSYNEWLLPGTGAISVMFYGEFLKYYKRYCDLSYIIPGKIDKEIYKKKMKLARHRLFTENAKKVLSPIKKLAKSCLNSFKKILRKLFPTYRAICGTRDILLQFQTEQRDSVNYLHYKIDKLSGELDKKTAEIKKLNKRLEKMQGQSNDKSK